MMQTLPLAVFNYNDLKFPFNDQKISIQPSVVDNNLAESRNFDVFLSYDIYDIVQTPFMTFYL